MQMNTLLWLSLLGLASLATAHFSQGGDFCTDEKNRFDDCKPLVNHDGCKCSGSSESHESGEVSGSGEISGSGSGSGSGWEGSGSGSGSGSSSSESNEPGEWDEGEYCYLLQVFWNVSITLEVDIQIVFQEWINKTQLEIVQNGNLTEYEIIVQLWYSFKALCVKYTKIQIALEFVYIEQWGGYVCDLEGLAIDIQTATTEITIQQVIEISGNNGSCPLTEALDECGQSVSGSDQDAIEELISEITIIIEAGYSFSETLVLIYEKFEAFFEAHASLKTVVFEWNIKGFGCIESYYDICATYWRIAHFPDVVGGSDESSCPLLDALDKLWQDTNYSVSQRQDFKELHDKFKAYIAIEVDIKLRLDNFTAQLYELLILAEWDISGIYVVEITFNGKSYGTIYQLIYAYIYCQNNGIGPGDFTGGPSNAPVTTTPSAATTTPLPNGDCSTVTEVNKYTVSTNITILLKSIDKAEESWETSEVTQFSGYKKRIYNISINGTATDVEIFNGIKKVFTGFAGSTTLKTKIFAVFIESWGTVDEYCKCSL